MGSLLSSMNAMDMIQSMLLTSISSFVILYIWWNEIPFRIWYWLKRQLFGNKGTPRLPPGDLGLPFVGHFPQILSDKDTYDQLVAFNLKRKKQFNDQPFYYMSIPPFFSKAVIAAHHDACKWVLSKEHAGFEAGWPKGTATLLGYNSLSIVKGKAHGRLRSALLPLFQPGALRTYVVDLNAIVADHLQRHWKPSSSGAPRSVNVRHSMKLLAFEVVLFLVLGLDLKTERKTADELHTQFEIWLAGLFVPADLAFIPNNPYSAALAARKEIIRLLNQVINRRREEPKNTTRKRDFLAMLLEPRQGENGEEVLLNNAEIADIIIVLLFAGSDTTGSTLTWILKRLEEDPAALEMLRQEHRDLRNEDETKEANDNMQQPYISWDQMESLRFTNKVILESIRTETPVGAIPRQATQDMVYQGYLIPKGTVVSVDLRTPMMNPKNFDNEREYHPERFDGDRKLSALLATPNFLPFGHGKRMCLGYRLSIAEITVILHHVLHQYRWKASPTHNDELVYFPIRLPKDGYDIEVSEVE